MCSLYVTYIAIIYLANMYIISTVPQHPQILATPLAVQFAVVNKPQSTVPFCLRQRETVITGFEVFHQN